MPGSPTIHTTERLPLQARSQARCSCVSSASRPTKLDACGESMTAAVRAVWRRGRYRRDGGNEAIATPRRRFDEARTPGVITQHGPQIADRRLQHRVADELVPPDFVQQRLLGTQSSLSSDEFTQQREWFRRKRDGLPVAKQAGICFVKFECFESQSNRIRRGHGPDSPMSMSTLFSTVEASCSSGIHGCKMSCRSSVRTSRETASGGRQFENATPSRQRAMTDVHKRRRSRRGRYAGRPPPAERGNELCWPRLPAGRGAIE